MRNRKMRRKMEPIAASANGILVTIGYYWLRLFNSQRIVAFSKFAWQVQPTRGDMHGWCDETIAGFSAMGASRSADAAAHWLSARNGLRSFVANEALVAAAETNTGVAYLLLRRAGEAHEALGKADRAWQRCLDGIATADVELFGSSSSFHLSLASRNTGAFQNALRRRIARQCEAGLAITRFNRLLIGGTPAASDAHEIASLLADVLGPRSPEVRLLHASSCDSLYAEKATELTLRSDLTSTADERRSVASAVALTALLRPDLLVEEQRLSLPDAHSASPP